MGEHRRTKTRARVVFVSLPLDWPAVGRDIVRSRALRFLLAMEESWACYDAELTHAVEAVQTAMGEQIDDLREEAAESWCTREESGLLDAEIRAALELAYAGISVQTICLSFAVPANLDLPSETLLKMRSILLGGLAHVRMEHADVYTAEERLLVDALLTES